MALEEQFFLVCSHGQTNLHATILRCCSYICGRAWTENVRATWRFILMIATVEVAVDNQPARTIVWRAREPSSRLNQFLRSRKGERAWGHDWRCDASKHQKYLSRSISPGEWCDWYLSSCHLTNSDVVDGGVEQWWLGWRYIVTACDDDDRGDK